MPQTYDCPVHGPISHLDVVQTSSHDVAANATTILRTCETCGSTVKPGAA